MNWYGRLGEGLELCILATAAPLIPTPTMFLCIVPEVSLHPLKFRVKCLSFSP